MPRNSFDDIWKKRERRFNFINRISKLFILTVSILIVVSSILYIWGFYQVLTEPKLIGEWFSNVLEGFQGDGN